MEDELYGHFSEASLLHHPEAKIYIVHIAKKFPLHIYAAMEINPWDSTDCTAFSLATGHVWIVELYLT